jgi:hypothetical protein
MSRFQKLLLVLLGATIIVYLFNCSEEFTPKKEINEKEIIVIALQNYDKEIQNGSETIDIDLLINQAILETSKKQK